MTETPDTCARLKPDRKGQHVALAADDGVAHAEFLVVARAYGRELFRS